MRGHTFPPFRKSIAASPGTDAGSTEADCFSDEVIVDFPSVAPAIDRIRRGFVDHERSHPVSTAIQLSSSDARAGITLPVSIPVHCTCRGCGGRGESWMECCQRCAGSGTEVLEHQLQITVPPGIEDGTRVQFVVTPPHHPPTRIELRIAID